MGSLSDVCAVLLLFVGALTVHSQPAVHVTEPSPSTRRVENTITCAVNFLLDVQYQSDLEVPSDDDPFTHNLRECAAFNQYVHCMVHSESDLALEELAAEWQEIQSRLDYMFSNIEFDCQLDFGQIVSQANERRTALANETESIPTTMESTETTTSTDSPGESTPIPFMSSSSAAATSWELSQTEASSTSATSSTTTSEASMTSKTSATIMISPTTPAVTLDVCIQSYVQSMTQAYGNMQQMCSTMTDYLICFLRVTKGHLELTPAGIETLRQEIDQSLQDNNLQCNVDIYALIEAMREEDGYQAPTSPPSGQRTTTTETPLSFTTMLENLFNTSVTRVPTNSTTSHPDTTTTSSPLTTITESIQNTTEDPNVFNSIQACVETFIGKTNNLPDILQACQPMREYLYCIFTAMRGDGIDVISTSRLDQIIEGVETSFSSCNIDIMAIYFDVFGENTSSSSTPKATNRVTSTAPGSTSPPASPTTTRSPTTTPTIPPTTTTSFHPRSTVLPCIQSSEDCQDKPTGEYPVCAPLCEQGVYMVCVHGRAIEQHCPMAAAEFPVPLVFDPVLKRCEYISPSCPRHHDDYFLSAGHAH